MRNPTDRKRARSSTAAERQPPWPPRNRGVVPPVRDTMGPMGRTGLLLFSAALALAGCGGNAFSTANSMPGEAGLDASDDASDKGDVPVALPGSSGSSGSSGGSSLDEGGDAEASFSELPDGSTDSATFVDVTDGSTPADVVDAPSGGSCTCMPQAPSGWTLVVMSTSRTSCLGAWAASPSTSHDGLSAPPATCGCSCGAPSASACTYGLTVGQSCNFGCSGGCTSTSNLYPASNACVAASAGGSVYTVLGSAGGAGGSCAPQPSANAAAALWAHTALACSPSLPIGAASCGSGNACVPAAPSGFTVCAEQAGDLTCPFGTKQLEYAGVSDTRGCSSCTCGSASGFSCGGTLNGYSSSNCTGSAVAVANCGTAVNSMMYVASPSGSCSPSSATATGSASPTGPVTFCCL